MIIAAFILLPIMYFSPAMIAVGRNARQTWSIAAFNVLFGWTIIGWVAALIWSLASPSRTQQVGTAGDIGLKQVRFSPSDVETRPDFARPFGEPRF